jgi:replicative DNA helicase
METSSLITKLPPHSLEAEMATLGAMMLEREAIARVVDILEPGDFYREIHRWIYDAICSLFNEGEPVDLITLGERLKERGQLEQVGGTAYLNALLEAAPTAAAASYYSKIVREKSSLRHLIQAAGEMSKRAYESGDTDVEEVIDECERLIFSIGERTISPTFMPLGDLLSEAFERIDEIQRTHMPGTGLHTGFADFDSLTSGLQPADLIVIASRPSMGKTALALNVARNVGVKEKASVAVFSLEMAKEQVALRFLCSEAKVDQQAMRQGYVPDEGMISITRAAETLYRVPIYVDDTPTMSVLEIRGKARRLKAEKGLGLIIVDYLQLVHGFGRFENRNQEISQVARSLKALARELHVPVVALSQLSRAVEARSPRRPQLSDLRESGSIEQEADVVAFIYRPAYYGEEELRRANYLSTDQYVAEIIIAKQRNGPVDTIRLEWNSPYVRFENLAEGVQPPDEEEM